LIAALCEGLIVIEAAMKSGTLITVEHALALGKDVFVVPGSPLDPRSAGGNQLLKQGAIMVESAEDVLAYYRWPKETVSKAAAKPVTKPVAKISEPVGHGDALLPQHSKPSTAGLGDFIPAEHVDSESSVHRNSVLRKMVAPAEKPTDKGVKSKADEAQWLTGLGIEPISLENLHAYVRSCDASVTPAQLMSVLLVLELEGRVERTLGGLIQRVF
jgi:predicted Rossmann fold nucleotide-binding protein DprA/Smf involved in DNA uptake